ncbi:MAG: flagellar FliJ protein [Paraglaciecola sp.]|jgi:flagellar FliJ protein
MAAKKQLEIVADWERQKEQKLATDYQLAQQNVAQNKQKLAGIEQYKVEYLREGIRKGQLGLPAQSFGQHQSFVGNIDKACEQQNRVLSNALIVADQRKQQWLVQQRKRKAIEFLLDKKQAQALKQEDRIEQQMLDELSLQKFLRAK